MATLVSQPLQLSSALRCVEYKFNMPSAGVAPEEKKLIYRLKNVTDNEYLAPIDGVSWKEYPTVADGQDISIDFVHDLRQILKSPKPLITAAVPYIDNEIIKTIEVDYGERTVNTDTCVVTDVQNGTTSPIDVLNGIRRHMQIADQADILASKGIVLHDRAKRYSVSKTSADFLYVVGSKNVTLYYYTSGNVLISSVSHIITQPYPNSAVTVIPIGFNIAPSGTNIIHVCASDIGVPTIANNLLFTVDANFYGNERGANNLFDKDSKAITDLYIQNNFGAYDLMCFESVESMAMNVSKQEIIQKFDCSTEFTGYATDQRLNINNVSFPEITFKRTWNKPLTFGDQKWLNELAASNNVWIKENLDFGFSSLVPTLIKFQLSNSAVQTRGGTSEFVLSGYYSEVYLYPY